MDLYRAHSVTIRKEDEDKADKILCEHYQKGDLDDHTIDPIHNKDREGNVTSTYWIKPYIYEDFETIVNEFKEAGIQVW